MPISYTVHWWGIKVYLSHQEACWAVQGGGALATLCSRIPTYGWIVALAIGLVSFALWLATTNSGGQGVILYIDWTGRMITMLPRGSGLSRC